MNEKIAAIREEVVQGRHVEVATLVQQAVDGGADPEQVLNQALISAMDIVGNDFSEGRVFVPEMLVASRAMKQGLEILKPLLVKEEAASDGESRILLGTVAGDLHDIGKNLVIMMLEGAGHEVVDLGTDVSSGTFVAKVNEIKPSVLGLSALLTTTMPAMKQVVDALVEHGVRDGVKVVLGGAPVTSSFADEIGADGYAEDAFEAVKLVESFAAVTN